MVDTSYTVETYTEEWVHAITTTFGHWWTKHPGADGLCGTTKKIISKYLLPNLNKNTFPILDMLVHVP